MTIKKLVEAIPFALLLGLVPQFYLTETTFPQAIIILGVAALCGYRLYCMDRVKPNYVEIFRKEFDDYKSLRDEELTEIKSKHEHAMVHLELKVKELNANYGKVTMEHTQKRANVNKFEF